MPRHVLGNQHQARRGWLAALAALVGLGTSALPALPSQAQPSGYRPAATAPTAWLVFAERARGVLAERFAADDATTEPLRRRVADGRTPADIIVRVWLTPRGLVEGVAVESVDTSTAALVQALIGATDIGAEPPPDMAQPLRLKLTVAAAVKG